MQLIPSYTTVYTPERFEHEFALKFKGPGLYATGSDTLVVLPNRPEDATTEFNVWDDKQPDGTLYQVSVYNVPFDYTIFGVIDKIPLRGSSNEKADLFELRMKTLTVVKRGFEMLRAYIGMDETELKHGGHKSVGDALIYTVKDMVKGVERLSKAFLMKWPD